MSNSNRDPIVDEVRATREAHAARFDYDLNVIVSDLKKHERQGDRHVVCLPAKRLERQQESA